MMKTQSQRVGRENDHIVAAADDDFSAFELKVVEQPEVTQPTRVMNLANFSQNIALAAARERAKEIGVTLASTQIEPLPSSPKALLHFAGGVQVITKSVFVIGRGRDIADLFLEDDQISRQHVAIIFAGGEFYVEDLESTNGSYINGERTKRARFSAGDSLKVGDHELTLHWED